MAPEEIEALKQYLIMPTLPDRSGRVWSYCPAHPDGQSSGRRESRGGQLFGRSLSLHPQYGLHCFAGCDFREIMAAFRQLGYSSPVRPAAGQHRREPKVIYQYRDANGTLIAEKARFEPGFGGRDKSFLWRLAGNEEWTGFGNLKVDIPLYNTHLVAQASPDTPVYIVEGEKAATACIEHGLLAVSPPNGANGAAGLIKSLQILQGRHICIWPDNDDVGRKFASQLAGILRPIARSLAFINVPVPPKGDAWDFFAAGCTVEDIQRASISDTPYAIVTKPGEYTVRYARAKGETPLTFTASGLAFARDSIEAIIRIDTGTPPPYRQRINLLSLSARQAMARELKEMYGDRGWARAINETFAAIIDVARQSSAAIDISNVQPNLGERRNDAVPGLIMHGEANLIYGLGSSGKTYASLYLFLVKAIGGFFDGEQVERAPVLWLDYETRQDGIVVRNRLARLCMGIGLDELPQDTFFYFPGRGIPVWDLYDQLDTIITSEGITLIGIDSALKAAGGAVRDEMATGQYFSLLQRLGITSLTLGHMAKSDTADTPFGSVFWVNEPHGYVWRAARSETASTATTHVLDLALAKANEGARTQAATIRLQFDDPSGPVFVTVDTGGKTQAASIIDQVYAVMHNTDGQLPVDTIAAQLRIPQRAIIDAVRQEGGQLRLRMDRTTGRVVISWTGKDDGAGHAG